MTSAGGVTVVKVLQTRPESLSLDLEILAGSGGLDRRILSPYTQKTGLHAAKKLAERLEQQLHFAGPAGIDESEVELPDSGEER